MNIYGRNVVLRAITMDDMQMICDMFNDSEMEASVVGWAFPIALDQQISWYKEHMNDRDQHRFVIETPEYGAVGVMVLGDIDWKNRTAMHGIKLAKKEVRGKGIGTDALMAILRYAFDELGMHRIESTILTNNKASIALHAQCGFKEEGILRECVYKNGRYQDVYSISILEHEYRKLVQNNQYWNC